MRNSELRTLLLACCLLCIHARVQAQADGLPVMFGLQSTRTVCELMGLGAVGTVPFNFPGADSQTTARYRAQLNPGIVESTLAPGANAAAPALLGGDLGSPFVHSDGKLHFVFGDSWFESPARSVACSTADTTCTPVVENNDVLASAELPSLSTGSECIALEAPRAPGASDIQPLTWDGPANAGGQPLGAAVPGPGFSTGPFMFVLTVGQAPLCEFTQHDCAAANGLTGDVCKLDASGLHRCYFGECGDDPQSPCAFRFNPNKLLVHVAGTDFTEPTVGLHIESEQVIAAYRGHFSAVSFRSQVDFATGSGKVWVIGRDSYWGAPGLTMSPYLMYHPVVGGRLEEPLFFAGFTDGEPVFSSAASDARPLYDEVSILPQHTSFAFEPELDGGTWLMIYGGHAQAALRNNIAMFVKPVVDELFYARDTGIFLRSAKNPWGPWSEPVVVFNPFVAGQGGYCEHMYFEDPGGRTQFACPADAVVHNGDLNRAFGLGAAGEYGAAIVPGASEVSESKLKLRWLLSTWNPYRVLTQESELSVRSLGN